MQKCKTNIQNNLKRLLANKGIETPTKKKLQEVGLSRVKFTRIINNTDNPSIEEAFSICEWLGCSLDELFTKEQAVVNFSDREILYMAV